MCDVSSFVNNQIIISKLFPTVVYNHKVFEIT